MALKTKQPELSIVIPAFREGRRIGPTLDALATYLKANRDFTAGVEVLVVAADAGDDTQKVVRAKRRQFENLRLLEPGPPAGKGRDVRYGMLRANGRYVLFMDADLATPLHHIGSFYRTVVRGSDVVIGIRDLRRHHPNLARRLVSICGNVLFRAACGLWIDDSQCGFKLFSTEAARVCFSRQTIDGWGFDMEILAIARAQRLRITAKPLSDWTDQPGSTMTDPLPVIIMRSLRDLGSILLHRMNGRYRRTTT